MYSLASNVKFFLETKNNVTNIFECTLLGYSSLVITTKLIPAQEIRLRAPNGFHHERVGFEYETMNLGL